MLPKTTSKGCIPRSNDCTSTREVEAVCGETPECSHGVKECGARQSGGSGDRMQCVAMRLESISQVQWLFCKFAFLL